MPKLRHRIEVMPSARGGWGFVVYRGTKMMAVSAEPCHRPSSATKAALALIETCAVINEYQGPGRTAIYMPDKGKTTRVKAAKRKRVKVTDAMVVGRVI